MSHLARLVRGLGSRLDGPHRMRRIGLTAGAIVLVGAPTAFAAGNPITGGARNPSNNASSGYTQETQIIGRIAANQGGHAANTGGYVTRQSNKSDTGGGAIYGCRAKAGTASCVAGNNLANGDAFRFQATEAAATIGQLRFGIDPAKTVDKPPFVTNGTGLVKNLNADRLDGASKGDFVGTGSLLFAQVASDGTTSATRGVPSDRKVVTAASGANQVLVVPFSKDISACALSATASELPSNASTSPPSLVASIGTDKTTVAVTEINAGSTPYGVHLQVVC